jgi:two-component system, NarL family, nitrate/nitrite response regulator NarL
MAVRCLLVDDNHHFLRAARTLLEQGGVTVDVASTGDEAVRRCEDTLPDAVLIDIDLGGASGFEVARRIDGWASELRPRPSIILTSAHTETEFQDLILASPAVGFLPKAEISARAIESILGE